MIIQCVWNFRPLDQTGKKSVGNHDILNHERDVLVTTHANDPHNLLATLQTKLAAFLGVGNAGRGL